MVKGFIVLNPAAGEGNPEQTKVTIESVLGADSYDLHETKEGESLREVVQTAVQQNNYKWVAAVGGDGTITQVADGLAEGEVPLAIIPAGTGNVLAQTFNIPQETEAACQLLTNSETVRQVDAIRIGEHYFFLQVGIGLEAATMQSTSSAQKNRWGVLAYLVTAVKEAFGWQPYHFTLTIDGKTHHLYASELVIANASKIGVFGLEWSEEIVPDDGRIDIAVIRARSLADYVRVILAVVRRQQHKNRHIRFFTARQEVRLEAERPLPLHGDGEIIEEEMPLTAVVVHGALKIIVPKEE
jgi:YegS/Rv2252/BmrU family lipid kinase